MKTKITDAAVDAAMSATFADYRADGDVVGQINLPDLLGRYGAHHAVDEASMMRSILEAALPHMQAEARNPVPAQPSPAAQGDSLATDAMVMAALQATTRETLAGVRDCDSKVIGVLTAYGIDGAVHIPTMVRAMLEAALVARQPVGKEPITVEAVATVRRDGEGDRYIDWLTEGGIADLEAGDVLMVSDRSITDDAGSGEVYAAPPAQAVDLGQLQRYQPVGSDGMNMERIADGRWVKLADVRALIDSQAVRNG